MFGGRKANTPVAVGLVQRGKVVLTCCERKLGVDPGKKQPVYLPKSQKGSAMRGSGVGLKIRQ